MRKIDDPLQKSLMLSELQCRNATLFHRVIIDEIEEIAPLVYTPTVGLVCQRFSHNYVQPRGMTFTPDDRGCMAIMMQNWHHSACQVVVVTDGSRILGLGDLGWLEGGHWAPVTIDEYFQRSAAVSLLSTCPAGAGGSSRGRRHVRPRRGPRARPRAERARAHALTGSRPHGGAGDARGSRRAARTLSDWSFS